MSEEIKTKERFFYIRVSNLHLDNSKPLFVGPFQTKTEAEESINQAMYNGMELVEGDELLNDPKTLNVEIVGGTAAKREGMKEPLSDMPQIENWIEYFPNGDYIKSNRGRPSKKDSGDDSGGSNIVITEELSPKVNHKPTAKRSSGKPQTQVGRFIMKINPEDTVIVTSNMEIVTWLVEQGIRGQIVSYVSNAQLLKGKTVIHISLPSHLIKYADMLGMINLDKMEPGDRANPTADKMKRSKVEIEWIKMVREE